MILLLVLIALVCVIGSGFVWALVFRAIIDRWRLW